MQAARAAVAGRLRDLRLDVVPRLTGRALAAACGWHESKVSKIEAAKQGVSDDDIRAWCRACGADAEAAGLIALNRRADKSYIEWRRAMRGGLTHVQDSFLPKWTRTRHFKVYEPGVIPGLCQTPAYGQAVLDVVSRFYGVASDVEEAARARAARTRLLREGGRRFAFLVEETALRSRMGTPETTAEQLGHLLSIAALPNVSFGVIPFEAERPLFPVEGFWIYDDAEVLVETVSAQLSVVDFHEVGLYVRTFEILAGIAVHAAAARSRIAAALTALDT
ncbi:helix-turn-helix domain-containing protein [Actinocorallia sp. API 0066]|uniref:Scr1 family TA system antitoxin-like transcriptional regulator n=1 Tax=Actinocorallia sp. API 0066 TaxID=2896846 RepID=UPI001E5C8D1B|nr:Scr1 family TA system antitoxin-like transcriptional regulator [Actinocorallia sp. API 0066]MCD0447865.1 helix-turn-helix domain-containing protein [Actinocorallia sp. API 0066]